LGTPAANRLVGLSTAKGIAGNLAWLGQAANGSAEVIQELHQQIVQAAEGDRQRVQFGSHGLQPLSLQERLHADIRAHSRTCPLGNHGGQARRMPHLMVGSGVPNRFSSGLPKPPSRKARVASSINSGLQRAQSYIVLNLAPEKSVTMTRQISVMAGLAKRRQ